VKAQRIYIVGTGNGVRLVRAAHRAQALSHAARSVMNVKVATQDDLVMALSEGIKVENAVEAETEELFEDKQQ
jgi:hypothetical protein